MKKSLPATLMAVLSLLLFSCNKNDSQYIFAEQAVTPKLESTIYPVVTRPSELVIGTEQSILTVGETMTVFLPYQITGDDIQNATLSFKDAVTGELVKESSMMLSTDLSILNVSVPEELQGTSFMFVTIPIEVDLTGKRIDLSTKIVAYKLSSEEKMTNAFQVQ